MAVSRLVGKNYVALVSLLVVLVAGILLWIGHQRLEAFHQYHLEISHSSLTGVEQQVSYSIAEKTRMVSMFAREHTALIRELASDPDNDDLHELLANLLTKHFPDYFAFSVADAAGHPWFEDFDGLISELCLTDLRQYAATNEDYLPYIHPNSEGYHYDIMVNYGKSGDKEGVFLVSFLAESVARIINSIQSSGHSITLLYSGKNDLIEITANGPRNQIDRNDYRLSATEQQQINMRHKIAGTRWHVVDFHNPELHAAYRHKLITDSLVVFFVFIIVAITLVVRLRREESQREFAEQQRTELMGVISHEFRSPAAIIKSALDIVMEDKTAQIPDELKEYVGMAQNSASRILLLVKDFLELQKMESGNLQFHKKKTELKDVIAASVENNKLYARQFKSNFRIITPLAEGSVYCDASRLDQVLTNLLSNAAKYGCEDDEIEISLKKSGNRFRVGIRDHGAGIPEKFRPRIFEKFVMAHSTGAQKANSSGLGLSIAKVIVEQHNGTIGFDSYAGKGTTFWFELPAWNGEESLPADD